MNHTTHKTFRNSVIQRDDFSARLFDLINEPKGYALFQEFMAARHCIEELSFLLDVNKYRKCFVSYSEMYCMNYANDILEAYIYYDSPYAVNISGIAQRDAISRVLGERADINAFNACFSEVFSTVLYDPFLTFQKTENYKKFVESQRNK